MIDIDNPFDEEEICSQQAQQEEEMQRATMIFTSEDDASIVRICCDWIASLYQHEESVAAPIAKLAERLSVRCRPGAAIRVEDLFRIFDFLHKCEGDDSESETFLALGELIAEVVQTNAPEMSEFMVDARSH